ncbi:hypothetical protein [Anderseniella sp. Alg231-50]|uniref:hypothetical protein n=1 Tax=Anderseniella sp. Alg231-50 TaxID=1922226 RepID=UPI000D55C691
MFDRLFQPRFGSLEEFTAKARKIFLLTLPFGVLFWVFDIGIGGTSEGGRAWLNVPMIIGAVGFVAWAAGGLMKMIKGTQPK